MEGDGGSFGGAVVDHAGRGDVGCDGGDRDDRAVVLRDHGWQEGLGEGVVGERVDGEGPLEIGGAGVEDGFAVGAAGVVNEDCGRGAEVVGYSRCAGLDGGSGRDVAAIVADAAWCCCYEGHGKAGMG